VSTDTDQPSRRASAFGEIAGSFNGAGWVEHVDTVVDTAVDAAAVDGLLTEKMKLTVKGTFG
jgi:hypothetical protein